MDSSANMASQQTEKAPQPLPNPYTVRKLPNPYTLHAVAEAAPVRYTEEQAKAEQLKKSAAANFHNPHNIKRPQAKGSAVKKPAFRMQTSSSSDPVTTTSSEPQRGIDWYRSTADDDAAIAEETRNRQYEYRQQQKEKKKFKKQWGIWNPDANYNGTNWTNIHAYQADGGHQRKLDGFANFLKQAKKRAAATPDVSSSDSDASRQASESNNNSPAGATEILDLPAPHDSIGAPSPPAGVPDDQTGEDAFARRARMQSVVLAPPPSFPPRAGPYNPTISAPPVVYHNPATFGSTNSQKNSYERRRNLNEPEEPPAKKPKLSKAEAMMAKMGWVEGQGLGKDNQGVVTALSVKRRKNQGALIPNEEDKNPDVHPRDKKWAEETKKWTEGRQKFMKNSIGDRRTGRPKIVSGHPPSDDDEILQSANGKFRQIWDIKGGDGAKKPEPSKFGEPSRVIVAWGCIEGIDWEADADRFDGGVRQEMGDAFGLKFGLVERIHVNMNSPKQAVYVLFNSPLGALNAVNRFDEGYEFRGNKILAQYYDEAKFQEDVFDH